MKICLTGNALIPYHNKGLVTGYQMAVRDLTNAFFQYCSAEDIYCFYGQGQAHEAALHDLYDRLSETQKKKIHFFNELDLLFYGADKLPQVDILHSVKEDAVTLIKLRESAERPIPLSLTVHSLSEQHLLTDMFYLMLLLPFQPYDAILCSSLTAKETIENILNRLEEILARRLEQLVDRHIPRHFSEIRLVHVPLGVDLSFFYPRDKEKARKNLQLPQEAVIFLWFGRFSDVFKADLQSLLMIFRRLLTTHPEKVLYLILAGSEEADAPYSQKLKLFCQNLGIEKQTRFLYNHQINNRAELYSACDVFVSPADNLQETFGLTPIEAMACGVPQLVSDWDGYRDTVVNAKTGFRIKTVWSDCFQDIASLDCFPSDRHLRRMLYGYLNTRSVVVDPDDFYHKMEILATQPELRSKMRQDSIQRARSCYGMDNTIRATEEVWKESMQIAASLEKRNYNGIVPMIDYCHDFSTYPTEFIKDTEEFEITEAGKTFCMAHLQTYKEFENFVHESALPQKIAEVLKKRVHMSIEELSQVFSEYTLPQIRRSTMYLYKYGIIRPLKNIKELQ